jgi:hypothetical protein
MNELLNRISNGIGECAKQDYVESTSLIDNYKRDLARAEQRATSLREAVKFLEDNPKFEEFFKIALKLR